MRKSVAVVIALAGFFIVSGIAARAYVYPRLAVLPESNNSEVVAATAPGQDATYFDIARLEEVRGPLQSTTYIRGDAEAAEQATEESGRDVVVWSLYGCTDLPGRECNKLRLPLSGAINKVAMDKRTGDLVPWSGSYKQTAEKDSDVPFSGLFVKFPFDTEERTYQFWDGSIQESAAVRFAGNEQLLGLDVMRFEQAIPPTKVGEIEVPGSVVEELSATVTGDNMYSVRRTFLVEPTTGVVVDRVESVDSYLSVGGDRALTITQATLKYDDATIADTVAEYGSLSTQLATLRNIVPPASVGLGLALLAGAVLMQRRSHRRRPRLQTPTPGSGAESAVMSL